jgi:hypothetical protein
VHGGLRAAQSRLPRCWFAVVEGFGVYGLHVWIERENPRGLFAPWNPAVSCKFAD